MKKLSLCVLAFALLGIGGSMMPPPPLAIAQPKPDPAPPVPPAPGPDIDAPSVFVVRAGHIHKLAVKSTLKTVKWINLNADVDLIPSDNGSWVVVNVLPSAQTVSKMRATGSPATYKIAAYGAKTVNGDAIATDPVYVILQLDAPPDPTPVPPTPVPPVPPPPTPSVAPIPVAGNRVLIVYESAELSKYPASQAAIIYNAGLRSYLNSKCIVGPDGKTKDWFILDKDADVSSLPVLWKNAMALPRQSLPWLIVSTGTTGISCPLPTDAAATTALIQKYFGP